MVPPQFIDMMPDERAARDTKRRAIDGVEGELGRSKTLRTHQDTPISGRSQPEASAQPTVQQAAQGGAQQQMEKLILFPINYTNRGEYHSYTHFLQTLQRPIIQAMEQAPSLNTVKARLIHHTDEATLPHLHAWGGRIGRDTIVAEPGTTVILRGKYVNGLRKSTIESHVFGIYELVKIIPEDQGLASLLWPDEPGAFGQIFLLRRVRWCNIPVKGGAGVNAKLGLHHKYVHRSAVFEYNVPRNIIEWIRTGKD